MKIRTADCVRAGIEACLLEAMGSVRSVDFFTETMLDDQTARFMHKSLKAQAEARR